MKNKIIIFVGICWVVVVALFAGQSKLEAWLLTSGFDVSIMVVFQWLAGIAVVCGAGIPFGIWAKSILDWVEEFSEESSITNKTKD